MGVGAFSPHDLLRFTDGLETEAEPIDELMKSPDPRYAVETARCCHVQAVQSMQGATHLGEREGVLQVGLVTLSAVLMGYAVELYLKALIHTDKQRMQRGHELDDLFNKLAPRRREAVQAAYEDRTKKKNLKVYLLVSNAPHDEDGEPTKTYRGAAPRTALLPMLEGASRTFETWRYLYEQTGGIEHAEQYYFEPLDVLCQILDEQIRVVG